MLAHAVDAAKVTAVGDGKADITDLSPEAVDQLRWRGRICTGGNGHVGMLLAGLAGLGSTIPESLLAYSGLRRYLPGGSQRRLERPLKRFLQSYRGWDRFFLESGLKGHLAGFQVNPLDGLLANLATEAGSGLLRSSSGLFGELSLCGAYRAGEAGF